MCQDGRTGESDATTGLCAEGLGYYLRLVRREEPAGAGPARVPQCLLELELVHIDAHGEPRLLAPELAAGLRLAPLRRALEQRQRELLDLEGEYTRLTRELASMGERTLRESEIIRGEALISAVLQLAVTECHSSLRTMQPGGNRPPELLERARAADIEALRRGVRQQTIYQHAVLAHQPTLEYIRDVTAAGAEVRTLDHMADRLIICDDTTAFIPVDADRSNAALMIANPAIVAFLGRVFDTHWQRAHTLYEIKPGHRPDYTAEDNQQMVIRLLVSGATDARIARETGMSVRTVSSHVHALAKMLGSDSRAQLGYLIAVHGLVRDKGCDLPLLWDEEVVGPNPATPTVG